MPNFRPEEDCFLPAADLAARIREQKITPVEAIDALAARIEKHNAKLNAFLHLDLKAARTEAETKAKMLK
jgi:Asp-tRNA(Asn)/Glu-tRNA(Gln) amidotransferase A subunit family amidase